MTRELSDMAFPAHGSMGEVVNYGMTLRDYFAAKAMQPLINRDKFAVGMSCEHWTKQCAEQAYLMADAMLRARK